MKKIILILLTVILCFSCGTQKKTTELEKPTKILFLIDNIFNQQQLDSLCIADTISPNLSTWMEVAFIDYETNSPIIEKMYIKFINEDEIVYRIIKEGENFKITKRLTDN